MKQWLLKIFMTWILWNLLFDIFDCINQKSVTSVYKGYFDYVKVLLNRWIIICRMWLNKKSQKRHVTGFGPLCHMLFPVTAMNIFLHRIICCVTFTLQLTLFFCIVGEGTLCFLKCIVIGYWFALDVLWTFNGVYVS